MKTPVILAVMFVAGAIAAGCSTSASKNGTATRIAATAPPPQTPGAATAPAAGLNLATPAAIFATPQPPAADVAALIDKVKLSITELPRNFSYGQFQAYQPNEQAVNGYDVDPKTLLDRMNQTGRLGGYVQQILVSGNPAGIGVTEEVWKDAAGAKAYFDNFPHPDKSVKYQEITLPQQLGEQVFAFEATQSAPSGDMTYYSIAWRNGRLILGAGEGFQAGKETLDDLMTLATLLDQKATTVQQ